MAKLQAFGLSRIAALAAIAGLAIYRLAPHLPNLTPVGAMFVLGGLYLGTGWAWIAAPFAGLFVSDVILNLAYDGHPVHAGRVFDYLAFAVVAAIARALAARPLGWKLGAVAAAPVIFFLISNFGVWLSGGALLNAPPYPKTLEGLSECYAAALPFFRGTLIGDWLFGALGLGVLEVMRRREHRAAALAA